MAKKTEGQFSKKESQQRFEAALRGAFAPKLKPAEAVGPTINRPIKSKKASKK